MNVSEGTGGDAEIQVRCPHCGYLMSVFAEAPMRTNKALQRAYEHALKNPILCAGCSHWVQRPKVEIRGQQ